MSVRVTSSILIVTISVSQFACTVRRPQKITAEKYEEEYSGEVEPRTGVHGVPVEDEEDKILGVVLATGDSIQFDEMGAIYVEEQRLLRGTTQDGDSVVIDMSEVKYVTVNSVSPVPSLVYTVVLTVGLGWVAAIILWLMFDGEW